MIILSYDSGSRRESRTVADQVIETTQRALGARVPGQVIQLQAVLRFAIGLWAARTYAQADD